MDITIIIIISQTLSNHPSLSSIASGRSQGYNLYRHRAVVCRSLLVVLVCSSKWGGSQEYVTYEFVPTSSAVSCMSGSSNFDISRDRWYVAVQLLLCRVLHPGLVQYCSQDSCVVTVKLFLPTFSYRPCIDTTAAWKKTAFHFICQVLLPYEQ